MKVVIQRVTNASCKVDGKVISSIKNGLLLFVGLTHGDNIDNIKYHAKKIANMRIFEDEEQKLNKSVMDVNGEILSISQFTLYASTKKGNRPGFTDALEPILAKKLYHQFNNILESEYKINTLAGEFGAHMEIELINDGPVTIILEDIDNAKS
ncbi:D-tyrosyl-tRNA(Tyr) deacylase [Candidatus Izimaplasma bacterium ZiA1]|uniref:D-aminoacyl-tRNA deacylase n=1 Tax=Candidatus Izimoplasma sp. ZiA1 TaxID=2024899 RepID=UPI000BAA4E31|nr:D-tyrosyl-tRNA(Tyr) deacylase [Candidatus Izimaplasma bacterium ZiA1]